MSLKILAIKIIFINIIIIILISSDKCKKIINKYFLIIIIFNVKLFKFDLK